MTTANSIVGAFLHGRELQSRDRPEAVVPADSLDGNIATRLQCAADKQKKGRPLAMAALLTAIIALETILR
ncbi:MAG TPA: hypothetical protein VK603_05045 [Candidatus Saccharimonadales bacterium]|nr:hypothetical protein [Candidatus Saccharimonadales bacterium]